MPDTSIKDRRNPSWIPFFWNKETRIFLNSCLCPWEHLFLIVTTVWSSIGTAETQAHAFLCFSVLGRGLLLIFETSKGAMAIKIQTSPHMQASKLGQPHLDVKRLPGKGIVRSSAQAEMITNLGYSLSVLNLKTQRICLVTCHFESLVVLTHFQQQS